MAREKEFQPRDLEQVMEASFDLMPILRKKLLRGPVEKNGKTLPMSQMEVLMLLKKRGNLTISAISGYLGMAKPNLTPLIDQLIDKKLVERRRDSGDRRMVMIHLLPEGETMLESIYDTLRKNIAEKVESLCEEELHQLSEALTLASQILSSCI